MKAKLAAFFSHLRFAIPLLWIVYALFVLATLVINISEFTYGVPTAIRPEVSTLISIVLVVIGTIYAAYDILGGATGPLRWVTLILTYAVVGALGIGQLIGLIAGIYMIMPEKHLPDFVEVALFLTCIGLLVGVFGGILITLRSLSISSTRKKVLSVGLSGLAGGSLSSTVIFILNTPNPTDISRLLFPAIAGAFGAMLIQGLLLIIYYRKQLHIKGLDKKPRHTFSWLDGGMGFILALLLSGSCVLYVDSFEKENFFLFSLLLTIPLILTTGFAHFLFWRVSHLSKYALAAFGLALIVAGTLLQMHSPLSSISSYLNPPKLHDTVRDGYFEFTVTGSYACPFPDKNPSPTDLYKSLYCVDIKLKNIDYGSDYGSFFEQDQQLISGAGRSFWGESSDGSNYAWKNIPGGTGAKVTVKFRYNGSPPSAIRLYGNGLDPSDGVEVKLR